MLELLYCIACPVGPFFKTGISEPVSFYTDPKFVRAWPGGIGKFKMGAREREKERQRQRQKQTDRDDLVLHMQELWTYNSYPEGGGV